MKQVIIDGIEYVPKEKEKPLLADAKEGDLCQRRNGGYTQFHSKHRLKDGAMRYYFNDANGSVLINGKHCDKAECGNDIIFTEPLAKEHSAEWAWQMMKLGNKLSQESTGAEYYAMFDGQCYPYYNCNGTINRFGNELIFCKELPFRFPTGWQLYEPNLIPNGYYAVSTVDPIPVILERSNGKWLYPDGTLREFESVADIVGYVPAEKPAEQPNPKFANVQKGDYVLLKNGFIQKVAKIECIPNEHDIVLNTLNNQFGGYYWFSGKPVCRNHSCITRILSPSEVVVKIQLEGTVSKRSDNSFMLKKPNANTMIVYYDQLDPATAEIVRELIAKQGER